MATRDEDAIEHVVVSIGPKVEKTFRADTKAQVEKALAGLSFKVKLVADGRGFNASARLELAKQAALKTAPTYKVKLVADATGFNASARKELRKQATLEQKVKLVAAGGVAATQTGPGRRGSGLSSDDKAERATKKAEREAKRAERILYSRIREPVEKFEAAEVTAHQNVIRKLVNSWEEEITRAHVRAYDEDRRFLDRVHSLAIAEDKRRTEESAAFKEKAREKERAAKEKAEQAASLIAQRESDKRARIAEQESRRLRQAFQGPPIIDWGGRGVRPMNLFYASLVAVSPALIAMASSAVQASTSLAALGSAAVGTGLLITGLTVAFSGLTNLLSLRKTALAQAATEQANSAVTAAENALTELRNRNNMVDAVFDQVQAEKDLHTARTQAARDLVDLRNKVADLQNQQRADTVSLAEAEANKQKVYRSYFASALERARADQDVRDARQRLTNTGLARKQAQEDLTAGVRKGVEQSDRVTDARDRLRRARNRVAEQRLANANAGITAGAGRATSAQANLKEALDKASPALREMYFWVDANEKRFEAWARQIQQAFLPGFNTLLDQISTPPVKGGQSTIQFFVNHMSELGRIVSKYAANFGKFTNTPFFRSAFATMQANNATALDNTGAALEKLQKPLLTILEKASPLLVRFSEGLVEFATWFDEVIAKANRSGDLAKWFDDAGTAFGLWMDVGKNLLKILGNVFKASLPSGTSLVERLRDFLAEMAKWTGSATGQEKIKNFFEFFKNLPYGDIAQMIGGLTTAFLTWRTIRFVTGGPINLLFSALGTLAAGNPQFAADLLTAVADKITKVLGFISDHPNAVAGLLGIFAAARAGKAIGFDIKIPGVDALKTALTSRFAILDKVFGGAASTGTMTVQAAVVNVYGGAAGAAAGAAAGDGKKGGLLRGVAGTAGAAAALIGGLWVFDQWQQRQRELATAPGAERQAFSNVEDDIQRFSPGGGTMPVNDPKVLNRQYLKEYVEARKDSVQARVEEARAAGGEALAMKVLNEERVASVSTLSQLLIRYGYTAPAAQRAAFEIFGSADALVEMSGSADAADRALKLMGDTITADSVKVGDLNEKLDAFSGKRIATLEVSGTDIVFKSLREAAVYQLALLKGVDIEQAGRDMARYEEANRKRVYVPLADGGKVPGYSPHSRADNIPALLTANEYVQPVDAVKHYGHDFMEAVRTKQFPRFAEGGQVSRWKFPVDISKTVIPDRQAIADAVMGGAYGGITGGQVVGDSVVAEIAEATARAMGATEKQLVALISAGIVESGLRNLNYGDRDSLGFLQQRPSMGWGSPAQVMNVAYATRKFIEKARRVDRAGYTAGQLAQAVQVSALPHKYAEQEANAVAVLNRVAPMLSSNVGGGFGAWPSSPGAQRGNSGVWRSIHALVRGSGIPNRFGNAYRPGDPKWHGSGRAIDYMGFNQDALARFFMARQSQVLELIHRTDKADYAISRGRRVSMPTQLPLHRNHLHIAMNQGGLVPVRKYDRGGVLPPGFTLAFNGTRRNETVRTHRQERQLDASRVRLHKGDISALAAQIATAASPTVQMDGRRVAEITNQYTYLPAGV